ncbi:MAG: efflux RND transporter permease subunit [Planctomycetota bacterium]|nr:efflux RND transporter permease subunit [Planctomycetota bacterium]
MTLPELAIRRHVTMLMIIVSVVVLGAVAISRLPLAFLPDVEEPELNVHVPWPNSSPKQVERMIMRPVEDALGSVNGLKRMWSRCYDSGASLHLEFDWSVNLHVARVDVWEKLERIRRDLPEDIGDITVGEHWRGRETDDPVLEGRIASELDLSESYDLLERKIVRPLQRVPGVAQVVLDGVSPKEVHINLRLTDLELHRMDVREVSRILRASNFDQSLGKVTEGDTRYSLRTVGAFASVGQIRDLVLRADGLRLRDVADVVYEEPKLEFGRHLDGNFAVGISVSADAAANVVAVCEALEQRIAEMDDDPELKGVTFLVWESQGEEIKKTLKDLLFTGIFGAVLAALILFAFLHRTSTTLIAFLCIPFSLIVACGIIWLQGSTLNTLSLLGLIVGIGMLVDNAVVVIENIFRHQEMGEDPATSARLGAREVSTAVIAATLTSVIVFLPVVYNRPSELSIPLKEIGLTVCYTLLASLFISQTLIPLATSWFIRAKPRPRGPLMRGVERGYVRLLEFNLRHRWLTILVGITVAASAIHPILHVDMNFEKASGYRYAEIRYDYSEDSTLDYKESMVSYVENILEPHRERLLTKAIYSWWSDGYSMTRIYMKEGHTNRDSIALVRDRLREILPEIPGVKLEVTEHRRHHWRWDSGKRIGVQLIGEDSEVLSDLADEVRERIIRIEGLTDPYESNREGQQELHVVFDRDLAARYGVSGTQIADSVALTFRGRRLPRYRTADGEREMRLTLDEKDTESLSQLHNLPIWTAEGEKIPLASVANFQPKRGANRIERENRLTSIHVGAHYKEGTREQYLPAVTAALQSVEFPYGYYWTFGSRGQRQREQSLEFLVNLLLALLLVFAVMSGLFESVRQAVALMIALPFAVSGAAWTLYLCGVDFDQPAAVGLLLLIGIVVNNGIVMIEHINGYRRRGMPRHEAMVKGGRERLRPILMTAMTTLLGLVPIVVQQPSLAGYYYYTTALVLIGGLCVSTFLTTVLLPTTVTLVEDAVDWVWPKK